MDKQPRRSDRSYALGNGAVRAERRALLHDPHIRALTEYVDSLRRQFGKKKEIPYFDPSDGGVHARILFILEAPGPQAVESGFCSIDNPDPSARNFGELLREAELSRDHVALWNVVPWYIGDGERIRPVNLADIKMALPYLRKLIDLLPGLRAVVYVGRKAQRAAALLEVPQSVTVCHSPSQQSCAEPVARKMV